MQRARSFDTSVLIRSLSVPFALVFKGLFAVLQTHAGKHRALILAIGLQCTDPPCDGENGITPCIYTADSMQLSEWATPRYDHLRLYAPILGGAIAS